MKKRITIAVVAVILTMACGNFGESKPDAPNPNAGPQQPVASTSVPSAAPAGPVTSFADGTYEVGPGAGQVPPGKYKSTVPADSIACYWARLKADMADIIDNGVAGKGEPVIVVIAPTDKGLQVRGCGVFTKS